MSVRKGIIIILHQKIICSFVNRQTIKQKYKVKEAQNIKQLHSVFFCIFAKKFIENNDKLDCYIQHTWNNH